MNEAVKASLMAYCHLDDLGPEDEALLDAMRSFGETRERVPAVAYTRLLALVAPVLLGTHLQDTAEILSALTGKSAAEVLEQPGHVTIADMRGCLDKDLLDFFMPSAGTVRTKS